MITRINRGAPHKIGSTRGEQLSRYRLAKPIQHQITARHRRLEKFASYFSGSIRTWRVALRTIFTSEVAAKMKSTSETGGFRPSGRFDIQNNQFARNNPCNEPVAPTSLSRFFPSFRHAVQVTPNQHCLKPPEWRDS